MDCRVACQSLMDTSIDDCLNTLTGAVPYFPKKKLRKKNRPVSKIKGMPPFEMLNLQDAQLRVEQRERVCIAHECNGCDIHLHVLAHDEI